MIRYGLKAKYQILLRQAQAIGTLPSRTILPKSGALCFEVKIILLIGIVKDGDLVEIHCDIGLYEARGEYQLNVNKIQKSGLGELFEAFQLLKTKLEKEGLFDEKNKKSIPESIKTIGVISSESGAVIKDIISTINRRNKYINIIIYPTQVQGPASIENIISAIQSANIRNEVDVLIIARGGGSIEDLWSFNDEKSC